MKKLTERTDIQNAQSLGQLLEVFFLSIQLEEFRPVLRKYGVAHDFESDKWYPTALILEIFEEIQKAPNASANLVSIGMKVTEAIDFKSRFPTFNDFMAALPQLEQEMHHGNPGRFEVYQIDDETLEVVDRTIWPHDLEYGVLYGICRLYQNERRRLVERTSVSIDPETGDEAGIYRITWR